jgi:hypothetical protein
LRAFSSRSSAFSRCSSDHFTGENIARIAKQSPSNCFELIAVGSEEARLRASLRPPLKLHVRFSRMQLSRRLSDAGMLEKELS